MNLKFLKLCIILCGLFSFSSCDADFEFALNKNGNADIKFNSAAGDAIEKLIKSVSGSSAFDAAQMKKSFSSIGFSQIQVQADGNTKIDVQAILSPAEEGLKTAPDAIKILKNQEITITISSEVLQEVISALDEDIKSYTDLFMTPVFTGEEMNKDEYIELLAGVYGSTVAGEISSAILKVKLTLPAGKTVTYNVPLVEVLLLSGKKTLVFKI